MKDRSPLFMGPSDIDWLVASNARSQAVPRTFLPCCDDEDPDRIGQLDAVTRRAALDADVAVAMRAADVTIGASVLVWRAIRALLRPLFPERPVAVRSATATREISEAA